MINMNGELLEYKKYQKNLNLAKFKVYFFNNSLNYSINSILITDNQLKTYQKILDLNQDIKLPQKIKYQDYDVNDFAYVKYYNNKLLEEASYDNGNIIFVKRYHVNIMQICYFNNNIIHKTDGPAIIRYNKDNKIMSKYFYLSGIYLKNIKSTKQFKKYLKLQNIK